MQHKKLRFGNDFKVAFANAHGQAAEMVIAPGDSEGDAKNRHRGADQWLFVLSGSGVALIEGGRYALGKGVLLLIERGEQHEIRNTGTTPLRTLNFYVPPAYDPEGDPLPRGKPLGE